MDLFTIFEDFPTHEACLSHLEKIRWQGTPKCPYCESKKVGRKKENDKVGRWNCYGCKSSFNVLSKTIFQGTKIPLQKWFVAISLILNAKKSLSSHQLSRDLKLNQKSAWFLQTRIRSEMACKQEIRLEGIVEADETYIGGKPRKANKKEDREPAKRGRGTSKMAVLGAVERGGQVVAQLADNVSGHEIMKFIRKTVNAAASELITDEYPPYNAVNYIMPHSVINHLEQYADGDTHTNTIEGFWSLLKRAWYGSHHRYQRQYAGLYIAESCYKYNYRKNKTPVNTFLRGCFG